ncbi:MAG: arginyltransferase [Proteobacteria bacterium]|nr:arginyltransferase [Pseudomonadota bacterium]
MTVTSQTARFYYSAPAPCPYLPGRVERRIFADLSGPKPVLGYDVLSEAGFRRSLGFAYRPACPGCNECVPVRILAAEFAFCRGWRRIVAANADLVAARSPAHATAEQYALFTLYQQQRHGDGEMANMDFADYRTMVEVGARDSMVAEFRTPTGRLVAAGLIDRLEKGLSAVYSFFDPALKRRSLGSYVILWLVEEARRCGLPYVYLGYWIAESRKMAYKARFQPLEALTREGWRRQSGDAGQAGTDDGAVP